MSKSFIDLLFILLCGTIVLLSQSLQIGTIKIAPTKIGAGGISPINADEFAVLAVNDDYMELSSLKVGEPVKVKTVSEICKYLDSNTSIVLTTGNPNISHQKIMTCWDDCRKAGFDVKLGVTESKSEERIN